MNKSIRVTDIHHTPRYPNEPYLQYFRCGSGKTVYKTKDDPVTGIFPYRGTYLIDDRPITRAVVGEMARDIVLCQGFEGHIITFQGGARFPQTGYVDSEKLRKQHKQWVLGHFLTTLGLDSIFATRTCELKLWHYGKMDIGYTMAGKTFTGMGEQVTVVEGSMHFTFYVPNGAQEDTIEQVVNAGQAIYIPGGIRKVTRPLTVPVRGANLRWPSHSGINKVHQ